MGFKAGLIMFAAFLFLAPCWAQDTPGEIETLNTINSLFAPPPRVFVAIFTESEFLRLEGIGYSFSGKALEVNCPGDDEMYYMVFCDINIFNKVSANTIEWFEIK